MRVLPLPSTPTAAAAATTVGAAAAAAAVGAAVVDYVDPWDQCLVQLPEGDCLAVRAPAIPLSQLKFLLVHPKCEKKER